MFNKHKKAMRNAKFKKLITRTIGHVKVDTVLTEERVTPGDTLIGEVRLSRKKGFKEIEKVSISLMQQFPFSDDTVANLSLITTEMRLSEEQKELHELVMPFEMSIPYFTPKSAVKRKCWIQTEIDLPYKLDPRDMDFIEVDEHPLLPYVNKIVTEELGFVKTNREEVIHYPGFQPKWVIDKRILNHPLYPMLSRRKVPVAHEIEYFPPEEFRDKYREIEFVYDISEEGMDLYVELQFIIPKQIGGYFKRAAISESDRDERIHKLSFTNEEIENPETIKVKLMELLEKTEELRI
ncbi:sporulation protein [Rossellomorea aquimaris]|uniref:sporulation protein n=1 Tax=Rossellomorea aquimaris TaxID=189382 RepID=UPI001CD74019|nr:sporulation protein [Rossellomorea aquimaris]MCA1057018.1 sporulation protein [Rossellomorea aquimaris]